MKCPACRHDIPENIIETHRDPLGSGYYRLLSCPFCSVVFSDPMKNPGPQWYQQFTLRWGPPAGREPLVPFWRIRCLESIIAREPKREMRVLDVGCGYGSFLDAARSRGCAVSGIDFDEKKVAFARARGIEDARVAAFETYASENPGKKFDIITFFQVLEHVDDPISFIENVAALLAPGGYILFDVPNRRGLLRSATGIMDYPPHHLTRWDMTALSVFLDGHDFSVIYSDDRLFPFRHFYALLLSWITMRGAALLKRHADNRGIEKTPAGPTSDESSLIRSVALAVIRALYYTVFVPVSLPVVIFLVPALSAGGRGLNCVIAARRDQ